MAANKTIKIVVLVVILLVVATGSAIFAMKSTVEEKVRQLVSGMLAEGFYQGGQQFQVKNIGNVTANNLFATEITVENVELTSVPPLTTINIPQISITRPLTSFSSADIMLPGPISFDRKSESPTQTPAPKMDIVFSTPILYRVTTKEMAPLWAGDIDITMPGEIKLSTAGIELFKVTFAPGSMAKISKAADGSTKNNFKYVDMGFSFPMAKIEAKIASLTGDGEALKDTEKLKLKGSLTATGAKFEVPDLPPLKGFLEKNNIALEGNGAINLDFKNSDKNNGNPIPEMLDIQHAKLSLGNYFISMSGKFEAGLKEDQTTPTYKGEGVIKINNLLPLVDELQASGLAPQAEAESAKAYIANLNATVTADADGTYAFNIKIEEGDKITINGLSPGEFMARLSSGNVTATVPESAVSPTPVAPSVPAEKEHAPAASATPAPAPTEPKPAQAEAAPSQPAATPAPTPSAPASPAPASPTPPASTPMAPIPPAPPAQP